VFAEEKIEPLQKAVFFALLTVPGPEGVVGCRDATAAVLVRALSWAPARPVSQR